MLALVADENLKQQITNGLRRGLARVDIVTIRQADLTGRSDPEVLAWAADEGRIVVTHDTRTMAGHAYDRVVAGEPMVGVVEVPDTMPMVRLTSRSWRMLHMLGTPIRGRARSMACAACGAVISR